MHYAKTVHTIFRFLLTCKISISYRYRDILAISYRYRKTNIVAPLVVAPLSRRRFSAHYSYALHKSTFRLLTYFTYCHRAANKQTLSLRKKRQNDGSNSIGLSPWLIGTVRATLSLKRLSAGSGD